MEEVLKAPHRNEVIPGLVNYYNRFLPSLSTVVHPFEPVVREQPSMEMERTMRNNIPQCERNDRLRASTVSTHYDPSLPLRLACDASPVGIGAVLSHVMNDGSE